VDDLSHLGISIACTCNSCTESRVAGVWTEKAKLAMSTRSA